MHEQAEVAAESLHHSPIAVTAGSPTSSTSRAGSPSTVSVRWTARVVARVTPPDARSRCDEAWSVPVMVALRGFSCVSSNVAGRR